MTLSVAVQPQISQTEPLGGNEWNIYVVDSLGNVGLFTSLALDSRGNPHISYYDSTNEDLKYARWNGTGWTIETVDSVFFVGAHTSIALGSDDRPHISYTERVFDVRNLKYAKLTEGWSRWKQETVDSGIFPFQFTSIALDSKGNPHISYRGDESLKYAEWNGSAWVNETVDPELGAGTFNSMALDSNDNPHISYAYRDVYGDDLRYARRNETGWRIETVEFGGRLGLDSSIAVDSSDNPHISYSDGTGFLEGDLKYARWDGSAWNIEAVDSVGNVGFFTSIFLDSNDYPHISYHDDYPNFTLKYARWDGSLWQIETVDDNGTAGEFTSIAVDGSGYPHISYYDRDNGDLKYATKGTLPGPENEPPVADAGGPYIGYEGSPIEFNASNSTGPQGGVLEYRWDFENDGIWDKGWSPESRVNHTWLDDFEGQVAVEVRERREVELDVINDGEYKRYSFVDKDFEQAQSFKPTQSILSKVAVDVSVLPSVEPNGDIILHIRETLYGSDIVNSSLPPDLLPTGARNPFALWPRFGLPDVSVAPGQQYFIVLTSPTCTKGYYHVEFSDDTYSNGTAYGKPSWSESFTEYPNTDLRFATFSTNLSVPRLADKDLANVTIENVAPTPEWTSKSSDGGILNPPYPEGRDILFEATVEDPGIYDTFTYDWDLGDGTILVDAGPSVTHAYGDNDTYIVVLTVTDDDGGVGIDDTPPLLTTNENPIPSISLPLCIFFEGTTPCPMIGEFSDPGWLDTHSAVWNFGDGEYEIAILTEENEPPDATGMNITSHLYGDNGEYNLTFTVVDDDGGVGTTWAEAQVLNLPPSMDMNAPSTVNEGEDFVLGITATDPGSDDIIISVDWGDGTSETETFYNNGIGPDPPNSGEGVYPFTVYSNITHTYGDNGNFTVQVTVEDDDGGSVQDAIVMEVLNLPPEIVLLAVPLYVNEGEEFSLVAEATDPGSDDIQFIWTFELGPSMSTMYYNDGMGPDPPMSPWGIFSFTAEDTVNHTYGDNGYYNVSITATDDDGGVSTSVFTIEIRNVEPSIDIGGPYAGDENSPIEFTAKVTDPGSDDLTFIWDWGDGTTDAIAFYNDGISVDPPKSPWGTYPFDATHTISHVWGDNGDFTVTLTVMDDDGGVTVEQTVVTVTNVAPTIEGIVYYLNASFSFRIAGEKWHNVEIHLYEDGTEIGYANITRYPGSPNDQMVTLADISIDFSKTYSAVAYYTPEDDPVNGQIWGATPAWVILEYEDGSEWIHHTFNVKHEDTWTWVIDDLSPYFLGHNITFVATASDPGSDDLTFTWNWGDGNSTENVNYNDGVGPDPYPSPEVNPITVTDTVSHGYASAGTYTITLTVTDDDGGITSYSLNLTL